MRKLSLVIAGILGAGSPLISQAATLGQAEVQSYLSEPLEVRVPLMRSSDEPLDEITVQLAPPSFYRDAGVPLTSLNGNLTFAIETERGQDYVLIGSKRPIRDPIISLLLQVQSPQGRMIRSYNLLLDPPGMASSSPTPEQAPARAPSRTEPTRSAPVGPSSDWRRVEPAKNLDLDATRTVQRGDTLSEIASEAAGDGQDIRAVMQAIIDANPHAFANGNGNAMMAGAELKVPTAGQPAEQADAAAQAENAQTRPALELLSPNEGGQAKAGDLGGLGELSREARLPAIADGAQQPAESIDQQNALTQEELESVKAENEALTEQLRSLKDQIDSVKVAVDERDATIANLKETIEESRQQAEQAQAAPDNFWVQWGKYLTGGMGLLILALLIALGLRRSHRDEEPAVPMPATADSSQESRSEHAANEPAKDTGPAGMAAAAVGGAAVGSMASDDDAFGAGSAIADPSVDDPMNPEMALEEARVLESFNLTHQALELLQESLAEHPRHEGLQAAINRLSGIEEQGGEVEAFDEGTGADALGAEDESATGEEPDAFAPVTEEPEEPSVDEPSTSDEWRSAGEEAAEAPSEPAGEISWDEDFDDMLATPESESASDSDDNLMEFDDSFALETPTEGQGATESDETLPELPEDDTSAASRETGAETTSSDEPEALDLDLSGYKPAGETAEGGESADNADEDALELDMSPEPEEEPAAEPASGASASDTDNEADIDTRVGLAEAFLDVGDRESFEMIEAELKEEGASAALQRLEELKQRHES